MNPRLREFLKTLGLATGSTDQQALAFYRGLRGEEMTQARQLWVGPGGPTMDAGGVAPEPGQAQAQAAVQAGLAGAQPADAAALAGAGLAPDPAPSAAALTATDPAGNSPQPARQAAAEGPTNADQLAERAASLRPLAELAGIPDPQQWANTQALSGRSFDECRIEAHRHAQQHLAQQNPPLQTPAQAHGTIRDRREGVIQGIQDAMYLREGVQVDQPHELAERMQNLSLVDLGRSWMRSIGAQDVDYLNAEQVARAVFDRGELAQHGVGGDVMSLTVGDFPGILSNVANKLLVSQFEDEPVTWNTWADTVTLNNLHETELHSVGKVPLPKVVRERGEYELVSFGEKKEKGQLVKRGMRTALTIEMFIQDNLNAFREEVMDFGGSTRLLENYLVYSALNQNPEMVEDSKAMFHTDHGNLAEGAGNVGAPSLDLLSKAMTGLRTIRGIAPDANTQARRINTRPTFLIVPVALEAQASQLVASTVDPTKNNNTPNYPGVRALSVVGDPELDETSTTAWYLTGPKRRSPVVLLRLRQFPRPTITRVNHTQHDMITYQLRDFVNATHREWRTAWKNPGA